MQHYWTLAQSLLYYDDEYISLYLYFILQVSLMAETWLWAKSFALVSQAFPHGTKVLDRLISEAYAFNHYQVDMSYLPWD